MFFPVKMCKVRVFGLRKKLGEFVLNLHETGAIELKDLSLEHAQKEIEQAHYSEVVEEYLKLEGMLKMLPESSGFKKPVSMDYKQAIRKSKKLGIAAQLAKIARQKEELLSKKQEILETQGKIQFFKKFDLDFSALESGIAKIVAVRMPNANFSQLKHALEESLVAFDFVEKEADKNNVIAIIGFDAGKEDTVKKALDKCAATIEALPNIAGTPQVALKKTHAELERIQKELVLIEKQLQEISKKYYAEVSTLAEILFIEKERAEATTKFSRTQDVFILEAFLPERDFAKLKGFVDTRFGSGIFLQKLSEQELHHDEQSVPTLLENPGKLEPFEFMTKFVSMPLHADIDPTIVFALVFPIIYGMMLGDAGYGLISLAFALILSKKSSSGSLLKPIANIWMIASFPTIFFGIIFNEYLGFGHVELAEKFGFHIEPIYHGIERLHEVQSVLLLTIATGFVVILLGFFLGFIKEWREHNKAHAAAKLAWVTLLLVGAALIVLIAGKSSDTIVLGVAGIVFLVSLAVIVRVDGIIGLIEIPSVAGNILSFSRILAVGLASVVVAVILNDLAFPSLDQGFLLFITLPIFLFGHAFNTFLGMFESFIQGARLNYVEFFSKFYSGGGHEFSPFKVNRKNTKR